MFRARGLTSVLGNFRALQIVQRVSYAKPSDAGATKKISAAKLKSIAGALVKREHLKVETDPHKLTTYVCGANINIDGEDPILKPDSEYPDWLWTLNIDWEPTPIEEMDKDSYAYWRLVRKQGMLKSAQQRKIKRKLFDYTKR